MTKSKFLSNTSYLQVFPFILDISKSEANEDFKTFYDITTGETKVMLGSYEYIIDTSYFGESEGSYMVL